MARVEDRSGRRTPTRGTAPRTAVLLVTSVLAGVLVAATGPLSTGAAGSPATALRAATVPHLMPDPVTDPEADPDPGGGGTVEDPTPTDLPTPPEPTVAPPTEAPTDPATTPPEPPEPTGAPDTPPTGEPVPPAPLPMPSSAAPLPGQSGPVSPPAQRRGVYVTTSDVTLTPAYWNSDSSRTDLRITVTNTGGVSEAVRLTYTLPAGLTDAGTKGCSSTDGRRYRCGAWTATAGARFSMHVRIRVDGDAWRQMPLNGSVQVTANTAGQPDPVSDSEGFAVLFPPGPPVPGMSLDAGQVSFDITGESNDLKVRLGNTGTVDAAGAVEVVFPDGVSVANPPSGCQQADGRTRCDLGTVAAGQSATLHVPVTATPQAQRSAPLAGAVVGLLTPRAGAQKRMQMSFKIVAAAAVAAPMASPAPTGSQGVLPAANPTVGDNAGLSGVQKTAITLIAVSVMLVLLALALATTSLRRRSIGDRPVDGGPAPAAATD